MTATVARHVDTLAEVSEKQWRDVTGVLKVQAERLDVAYMGEWAAKLGVTDLLERALRESGLLDGEGGR